MEEDWEALESTGRRVGGGERHWELMREDWEALEGTGR